MLAAYRFDRFRSRDADDPPPPRLERLVLVADAGELERVEAEARIALVGAEAANRARELQNLPANELTPEGLAERAREIAAAHERVEVEVLDRDAMPSAGWAG